jgi:hypothetical protein
MKEQKRNAPFLDFPPSAVFSLVSSLPSPCSLIPAATRRPQRQVEREGAPKPAAESGEERRREERERREGKMTDHKTHINRKEKTGTCTYTQSGRGKQEKLSLFFFVQKFFLSYA